MKLFQRSGTRIVLALGMLSSTLALNGCGTTNAGLARRTTSAEHYMIFDIKTDASRQAVAKAAANGLARNVNAVRETSPIPTGESPPEKSGRFKLVNPLAGHPLAALAAASGQSLSLQVASCDGAVWTANAVRNIRGSSDLKMTLCLWQYQGGYHLDMYGQFTKQEGGLLQVSRELASAMVGTPEQWTEKTFLDVVRQITATTGASVKLLEGQPELQGTPWLDSLDAPKGK